MIKERSKRRPVKFQINKSERHLKVHPDKLRLRREGKIIPEIKTNLKSLIKKEDIFKTHPKYEGKN